MRKKASSIKQLAVLQITMVTIVFYSSAHGAYNPSDAISYAEKWWDARNSVIYDECDPYQDFDSRGGDCANFVSQCLIAGGLDLSIHPDAWACGCFSTCTGLNDYLVNVLDITPEQRLKNGVPSWFEAGDVAIFGYSDLHPRTHAVIAVAGNGDSSICNAHSNDVHNITIQDFYDANPSFDRCTFYHIPRGFSGAGSGTEGDPYIITNVYQLQEMNDDLDAWYELGNNIDASDTKIWNGGAGFIPIAGDWPDYPEGQRNIFQGHFDGKEHNITALYIDRPGTDFVGLFGCIDYGTEVCNIGLMNVNIVGDECIAGLVGNNIGTIRNSSCTGSINGGHDVGGLVGPNGGTITNSYFIGEVVCSWKCGGLVGGNSGIVSNCYSAGNVKVIGIWGNEVGGLTGLNDNGTITDSYSTASVEGNRFAGGLVGKNNNGSITNCYSTGSVANGIHGYIGGLVGSNWYGSCQDSFWDKESSGQITSACGIGKTTVEMKQQATFTNWDFDNIWGIKEGEDYPYLKVFGEEEPDKPLYAQLAIEVVGADYLWGGKGFCYSQMAFIKAEDIFGEYTYWNELEWDNDIGKGLDCAGLIFWAYNKAHGAENFKRYSEPYNPIHYEGADGQYWENSQTIDLAELKPGDLLFFDWNNDGERDHVEMYVGDYYYEGGIIRGVGYPAGTYDIVAARGDSTHNYGIVPDRVSTRSLVTGFIGFRKVAEPLVDGTIYTGSPVDLAVTDPDGLVVNNQGCEVPQVLYYSVCDLDKDGENDDIVTISELKIGDYRISVLAEPSASPTDTYSLGVQVNGETFIFADHVAINDVPVQPYIIRSTKDEVMSMIPTTVDFDPDTLNPQSPSIWVTVYIELPVGHGYETEQIDITSLMLNNQVTAEAHPTEIGDYDEDGIPDLMVKFSRQEVGGILEPGTQTVQLTGQLTDGTHFAGNDTVRVLDGQSYVAVEIDEDDMFYLEEAIAFSLYEASETITELGSENFINEESAAEMALVIDDVFMMLDEGMYFEALVVLEDDVLVRIDGCATIGEPDEDDWITSFEGQEAVYPLVLETIELLESLM